jgi:hypothetical protein
MPPRRIVDASYFRGKETRHLGEKVMADIAVFIVADRARQGRGLRALKVFADGRKYFEGLQEKGAIENFEVGLAGPAAPAQIGAAWMVRGTEDQLRAVRESKEFRRLMLRAALVVENIQVVRFLIGGQPLLEVLREWEEELKEVEG